MKSAASTAAGRPRKSPLRADTVPRLGRGLTADPGMPGRRSGRETLSAADLRQLAVSEFAAWLSGKTNRQDRPFQEHTITNYADAARVLDKWRPATPAAEFIKVMLEVTGGGRGRDFVGIRDHAIIRVFTEGVRRTELAQMQIEDLSADLMARPFARVVPLKAGACLQRGPGHAVHPVVRPVDARPVRRRSPGRPRHRGEAKARQRELSAGSDRCMPGLCKRK